MITNAKDSHTPARPEDNWRDKIVSLLSLFARDGPSSKAETDDWF